MFKKVLFLLPFVLSFITSLHPATMHVFIGADTLTKVKSSSRLDIKNMTAILEEVAQKTGLHLKMTTVEGHKLTPKSVSQWIKNMHCSSDDVVFFYFTGHGFRLSSTKSKWPWLVFASTNETRRMKEYIDIVKAAPARLRIVFCDCCNNNLDRGSVGQRKSLGYGKEEDKALFVKVSSLQEGYKQLFLKSRGTIVASGATPGRAAWTTKSGGLFTLAFLKSLFREIHYKDACWPRLLDRTSTFCNIIQKPQYEVAISTKK